MTRARRELVDLSATSYPATAPCVALPPISL